VDTPPDGTPTTDPAGPPAPADLVPPPSGRTRLAWYSGAALLTAVLVVFGHCVVWLEGFRFVPEPPFVEINFNRMGFRFADLSAPFVYDHDTLLILPIVRSFVETGTQWRIDRMGCPGAAELSEQPAEIAYPPCTELYDFPVIDDLHFAILWLLGRVFSDVVVVFNLYYLLTWPLTTLTAMAVFRYLRLTLPTAAVGGILYAFAPYHYLRGEAHYFLAAYWVIPLSLVPLFAICRGEYPFFRREAGRWRLRPFTRSALGTVAIGAATAAGGAYYAFFACALYAAGGLYTWVMKRDWRAGASAGLVAGVVLVVGLLEHLPVFVYQADHPKNPITHRTAEEAEEFGMKLPQLVLPIADHNLTALAHLKARYDTAFRPLKNESRFSSLGALASVGLVVLLVMFVFPARRGWPYGPLTFLAGFVVLFALVGGLASLFNFFVTPQVRCPNRFSIFLAFLCTFAVLWPLDRFLVSRTGWARRLRYPVLVGLLALGIFDQTPFAWFGEREATQLWVQAERYRADREFFTEVERTMPEGARICTLPYIPYPEYPDLNGMATYDHARGYLHTRTLRWAYGAMKNREADAWHRSLDVLPVETLRARAEEILDRVVYRGFDGLFIDTRGYLSVKDEENRDPAGRPLSTNEAEQLIREMGRYARPAELRQIRHADGQQVFLDLRAYRDWLRDKKLGKEGFDARVRQELERPELIWLDGFLNFDPLYPAANGWWGMRHGTAVLFNPAERVRTFEVSLGFVVDADGLFVIHIDGPGVTWVHQGRDQPWVDDVALDRPRLPPRIPGPREPERRYHFERRKYVLRVPPGRHVVTLRCDPPPLYMPHDYRPLYYCVKECDVRPLD
jgi:hypothetical protein